MDSKLKVTSVRLKVDQLQALRELAAVSGLDVSELVRLAVDDYICAIEAKGEITLPPVPARTIPIKLSGSGKR
jgi:hypothetical protein